MPLDLWRFFHKAHADLADSFRGDGRLHPRESIAVITHLRLTEQDGLGRINCDSQLFSFQREQQ